MKTTYDTKKPRLEDFLNQGENKGRPNPKSKLWNKKIGTRTQYVRNKNPKENYCKKEIKPKQGCDKKTY